MNRRRRIAIGGCIAALVLTGCGAAPSSGSAAPPPTSNSFQSRDTEVETTTPAGVSTMESSWAFDVTNLTELRRNADAIVEAEIIAVADRGTFEFAASSVPKTAATIRVLDVISGEFSGDIVYLPGGTVTLQQLAEIYPADSLEKSGIARLSDEERQNTTQTIVTDGHVDLEPGGIYVLVLNRGENIYGVGAAGYGVFRLDDEQYVNELTKTSYSREDFR